MTGLMWRIRVRRVVRRRAWRFRGCRFTMLVMAMDDRWVVVRGLFKKKKRKKDVVARFR